MSRCPTLLPALGPLLLLFVLPSFDVMAFVFSYQILFCYVYCYFLEVCSLLMRDRMGVVDLDRR